jgi:hypothetical protein
MELQLRLNDVPPAKVAGIAAKMADLATRHQSGSLAKAAPGKFNNRCEDEGCTFIQTVVDDDGVVWLMYKCGNGYVLYLMN